jgi:anthranilate phosphoribosyltransferase
MAGVLELLGAQHALVVHGDGGMDELSITGPSVLYRVRAGHSTERMEVTPEELGLERATRDSLLGGTAEDNAAIIRSVLSGERGPQRDVVLMNAAAALLAAELVPSMQEGVAMAAAAIDSGASMDTLERLARFSQNPVLTGGPQVEDAPAPEVALQVEVALTASGKLNVDSKKGAEVAA